MSDMYLRFWWEEWEGVGVEGMISWLAGMGDMYLRFWWEEWEGVGVEGMISWLWLGWVICTWWEEWEGVGVEGMISWVAGMGDMYLHC